VRRDHTVALLALAAGLVAATPFFVATTFFGDDHLFLAFARHVGNPFLPFVKDLHGGEYYRPLWMFVWWLLARMGAPGALWPFALAALALHAGAAGLVFVLLRTLGRPFTVSASAGALMFLAPQNLAAALWFSATTDLLATVFVLGALIALVRRRHLLAALTALAAFLSKESAFVLPLLSAIVLALRARADSADAADSGAGHRSPLLEVAPQAALLAAVCVVRKTVLHGWGGSGDSRASFVGTILQIWAGFAQTFTGETVFPPPLAFAVGTTVLALVVLAIARQGRGGGKGRGKGAAAASWAPLAFAVVAAAPLLAAGWAVGARYYYLPSVGLCWAVAEALAGAEAGPAAWATLAAGLLAVGGLQASERRQEVISYDRRVAAARRAVTAGLGAGHHVFHIDGGIKDLDLAIKEQPALESGAVLVLGDVPASFAIVPPQLAVAAASLAAVPPLPPSGAYSFGGVRVVGLARRGDEPDLDEALARFPDLRFIRLRSIRGGQVIGRDVTEQIERRLDGSAADGQD
jgi:hypothetical protein